MDSIKTFGFRNHECCITKGEDNSIFFYSKNKDGSWDDFLDATMNPGEYVFVPEGYVCIKNECENDGVLDALVHLGIIHAPICSVPVGTGHLHLEMCEINEKALNEWDASKFIYV